ncbi:MAG: nuclease [Maricaulaceae bacterium]
MVDPVQVLWTPAGAQVPNLGTRALVDVSDGDTPNIRMPIRMLSIDTPEVTARSETGAAQVDDRFSELAAWIEADVAPVSRAFADYIVPRLNTGRAGRLQFSQGEAASAWFKARTEERLRRPNSTRRRNLFLRTADAPFDNFNRLLAYIAPSYSASERQDMTRKERATFNLDLIESGWAAPFILFPNIPGQLDLPLYLETAEAALQDQRGQYADPLSLPAFEYRMCERLYTITQRIVQGREVSARERFDWRSRYAADMRTRKLHGPESYMSVPMHYRIWIWPNDVQRAISALNLVPAEDLVSVS